MASFHAHHPRSSQPAYPLCPQLHGEMRELDHVGTHRQTSTLTLAAGCPDLHPEHTDSLFHLGSRRAAGVCQVSPPAALAQTGQHERTWADLRAHSMLPLVCNDAVAILFMFDLSRKSTLNRSVDAGLATPCGCRLTCQTSQHQGMVPASERLQQDGDSVPGTCRSKCDCWRLTC